MSSKQQLPEERNATIRQQILELLGQCELTIGDLSKEIGKSEKELYDHVESLIKHKGVKIIPAECVSCGFIFETRKKTTKPGKCPQCKGTRIEEPAFFCEPD